LGGFIVKVPVGAVGGRCYQADMLVITHWAVSKHWRAFIVYFVTWHC